MVLNTHHRDTESTESIIGGEKLEIIRRLPIKNIGRRKTQKLAHQSDINVDAGRERQRCQARGSLISMVAP